MNDKLRLTDAQYVAIDYLQHALEECDRQGVRLLHCNGDDSLLAFNGKEVDGVCWGSEISDEEDVSYNEPFHVTINLETLPCDENHFGVSLIKNNNP